MSHRGITCGIAEIASVAWPRYWWRRALHPLRGDAPVTWRCTRYVALHPIRTGAMPTERVQCLRIGCTAQRSNTPKKSLPPRTHHPQTGTHEATRPPSTAGVEGAGRKRRAWRLYPRAAGAGFERRRRHHHQPNFARNLSRSFFEMPQKRCNSNDTNAMFE